MCEGTPIALPRSWQSVRTYVPSLQATRIRRPAPRAEQRQAVDRYAAGLAFDDLSFARELVEPASLMVCRGVHRRRLRDPSDKARQRFVQQLRPVFGDLAFR